MTTFTVPGQMVLDCSHSGPCDDDCAAWLSELRAQFDTVDPASLSEELAGYGAWDDADRADHEANLLRLVWLLAGDIREDLYERKVEIDPEASYEWTVEVAAYRPRVVICRDCGQPMHEWYESKGEPGMHWRCDCGTTLFVLADGGEDPE